MFDIAERVKKILDSGPGKPEKIKHTKDEEGYKTAMGMYPPGKYELDQWLSGVKPFGISDEEREKRAERLRKKNENQN